MLKKTVFGVIGSIVIFELTIRIILGLGNPPLYHSSHEYEYMQNSNQHLKRFGNLYITNELSMRNRELDEQSEKILFLGDSVINGGILTDHNELATTIIQDSMNNSDDEYYQVLNISAGSWGPDNAAAYLEKYGDFNAVAIIALFSSHDAGDTMTFEPVVGVHPSFPDDNPLFATSELIGRYLVPRVRKGFSALFAEEQSGSSHAKLDTPVQTLNPGWNELIRYCRENEIPLYVYLHADRNEIRHNAYNANGQMILNFLQENNIPCFPGLEIIRDEKLYRDSIHLNSQGQQRLAGFFIPIIRDSVIKN